MASTPSSASTLARIQRTAEFLRQRTNGFAPSTGIILGSGLGGFADTMDVAHTVPYTEIPDFPQSTVQGHAGRFLFGRLAGKPVVVMQGRFHYYEGYAMEEVVRPVRVMAQLGIARLFVTNACGGLNPAFHNGDIMIITDHINLFPNALIGPNLDELGFRFPDMSEPYDRALVKKAGEAAARNGIAVREGVYVGLTGPTLETPAEYRFVRIIGGDAVGMSTVPEVIAARHMKLPCFGMSVITDMGVEGRIEETTHEMVQERAKSAAPKMCTIIRDLLSTL